MYANGTTSENNGTTLLSTQETITVIETATGAEAEMVAALLPEKAVTPLGSGAVETPKAPENSKAPEETKIPEAVKLPEAVTTSPESKAPEIASETAPTPGVKIEKFHLAHPEIMDQPISALIDQYAAHVMTRQTGGEKGSKLGTRVRHDLESVFGTLSYTDGAHYAAALAEKAKLAREGKLKPREASRVMNTALDFVAWVALRAVFGF